MLEYAGREYALGCCFFFFFHLLGFSRHQNKIKPIWCISRISVNL